jgi:hypothetical protein
MEINRFMIKTLNNLKKRYEICELDGDIFKITKGSVEVQIPLTQMYQNYVESGDYRNFSREYMDSIDELLEEQEYKVNYDMVFPLVRREDFGGPNIEFYYKPLFTDLNIYFGEDKGAMFRIILKNDKVDFEMLYKQSFDNLNKLINPLGKLNENLDVYSLKFNSDLASSMIFNKSVERSIIKIFGLNYLFAIPASSSLLIAPNTPDYVSILRELVKSEKDINTITNEVIEFNKGIYGYVKK